MRRFVNLEGELLREHSRRQADRIAAWASADPTRMKQLMELFLKGEKLTAQRAAWVVGICAEKDMALVQPYLSRIVKRMQEPGIHDAVRRCAVRILQCAEIPTGLLGRVATICFDFLTDAGSPVAVKVYAMTVLDRIALQEPDLRGELNLVIEQQLPFGSGAFRARARKVLRRRLEGIDPPSGPGPVGARGGSGSGGPAKIVRRPRKDRLSPEEDIPEEEGDLEPDR